MEDQSFLDLRKELEKEIKVVEEFWTDQNGKEYVKWLNSVLARVKSMDERSERFLLYGQKIKLCCGEIEGDTERPKVKRRM